MNALPLLLSLWMQAEIHRLGDECWSTREEASANLRSTLPLSLAAASAASNHRDPEIATRCRRLEGDWETLLAETRAWKWQRCLERARPLRCQGYRYTPYIDRLPEDWPDRCTIIGRYQVLAREQPDVADWPLCERWHHDRAATVLYAADLLLEGKSEEDIVALFERMVPIEKVFLERIDEPQILHAALAP